MKIPIQFTVIKFLGLGGLVSRNFGVVRMYNISYALTINLSFWLVLEASITRAYGFEYQPPSFKVEYLALCISMYCIHTSSPIGSRVRRRFKAYNIS